MTRYQGTLFGFNYDMEFDIEDEFVEWVIQKLKVALPVSVWEKVITRLIQHSDEYQQAKSKIQDHEARIVALES